MRTVRLTLQRAPASPGIARRHVLDLLADAPDSAQQVGQLLTSELVSNAVEHSEGDICLSARRGDELRIEVHDGSPSLPLTARSDPSAERGRGLHLIAELADSWGVTDDPDGSGKTVWCSLRLDA